MRYIWIVVVLFFLVCTPVLAEIPPEVFTILPYSEYGSAHPVIGMAANEDRLFLTRAGDERIFAFDSDARRTVFATLPGAGGGGYLALSSGMGGFPNKYLFAAIGSNIFQIHLKSGKVHSFATLPLMQGLVSGITFDKIGTFENNLIVTSTQGDVWRIDYLTNAVLVSRPSSPAFIENPDVAATDTFSPYGGFLFAGSPTLQRVVAVEPVTGTWSFVTGFVGASGIYMVPSTPVGLGKTNAAFFLARWLGNHDIEISKFASTEFCGMPGLAIVTISAWGAGPFVLHPDFAIRDRLVESDYAGNQAATFVFAVTGHARCGC